MKGVLPDVKPVVPPPLESKDAAMTWAEEAVTDCENARAECVLVLPREGEEPAVAQKRAYQIYLTKYGYALGVATALLRQGLIGVVAYNMFVTRAHATLTPTLAPRGR